MNILKVYIFCILVAIISNDTNANSNNQDTIKKIPMNENKASENNNSTMHKFIKWFKENPLIGTTILSALISVIAAYMTSQFALKKDLSIAKLTYTQSSLKDIITNQNVGEARKKIKFLIDSELIEDNEDLIKKSLDNLNYEAEGIRYALEASDLINTNFAKFLNGSISKEAWRKVLHESIINSTKSIDYTPDNMIAYKTRGFAYQKLAYLDLGADEAAFLFEKSIQDFNYIIKTNPDKQNLYYLRGLSYFNIKKYEPSKNDFQKAVELDSGAVENNYYLGTCYFVLHDYEKAKDYIDKGLSLCLRLAPQKYDELKQELLSLNNLCKSEDEKEKLDELIKNIPKTR
jgi:tetratricopeptide (TPR) repeat protein